jgi:lipopolysaccharide/colanic/teichoic acid biosynthesis glycosyltransferase
LTAPVQQLSQSEATAEGERSPTLWGLTPTGLHDRYWASRGVQVVRRGQPSEIVENAELFLLAESHVLCLFSLNAMAHDLNWLRPALLWVRVHDQQVRGYREFANTDEHGNFVAFTRDYGDVLPRPARLGLTTDPSLANQWRAAQTIRDGRRRLRTATAHQRRSTRRVKGWVYDERHAHHVRDFMSTLIENWARPDATISQIRRHTAGVWSEAAFSGSNNTRFVGSVWIGAGRDIPDGTSVVGPSMLWDAPDHRPKIEHLQWDQLEPGKDEPVRMPLQQPLKAMGKRGPKRAMDIVASLFALALTLPGYPLILLAIWLEDGRPFFFVHSRETLGGRPFPCLKFRSMRRDAERIKARLQRDNQVDGPQFYIENDPRTTKVGQFLRQTQLDEIPQFLNVLLGHMSLVGPRPSPYTENQYCPPWREARLSVRPGITGLWQIMRTRRRDEDFREWIQYDLEYVERASLTLDFWILWRTLVSLFQRD